MAPTQPTTATRTCAARTHCPAVTPGAITAHGAEEPGPLYAHLRRDHPVFYDPALDLWVLSRHSDIDTVLRDGTGTFSTARTYAPIHPLDAEADAVLGATGIVPALSSTDLPGHTRLRRVMTATFPVTDRAVRNCGAGQAMAEETAAAAALFAARPGRTGDLLTDYAQPAVMAAFGRLTGVPYEAHHAVLGQAAALTDLVWGNPAPHRRHRATRELADLWTTCARLVAQRQDRPANHDLITAWLTHSGPRGERMTSDEVASTLMEQLITVAELVPHAVAGTVARLCATGTWPPPPRNPPDDAVTEAVDATFRHHSPLVGWLRSTTRDVELSGTTVPAGARFLLLLASAPRDPDRPAGAPSLTFGAGIHYCPGAAYTRHLVQHAVTALADVCPALASADPSEHDPTGWPVNAGVRGPIRLTVTW